MYVHTNLIPLLTIDIQDMLDLHMHNEETYLLLELSGILDSSSTRDLDTWFQRQYHNPPFTYLMDLSKVTYISSIGISILLNINKQLKLKRGKLILFGLNKEVKLLLYLLHLNQQINITETIEDSQKFIEFP